MNKQKIGTTALDIVKRFFPGVTSVADAKKSIMIEVTPKDNRDSVALDHTKCALSVACKRTLEANGVITMTRTAYIIHGKKAMRFRLLESASREIVSFDRKAGFAPGLYKLRAPGKYEQLGQIRTGKTRHPSGRKRTLRHITSNIRTMPGGFTSRDT